MEKLNFFKNASIFFSFGAMGLVTCLIGATYLHMEKLFDVSSRTLSLSLTGCFLGSLLGAGICALLYHRINPELSLAFECAGAGLVTIGAYYARGIVSYVVCMSLQGVFFGVVCAAAPVYLITMWKDTRWNRPVLNCLYTFWSLGALLGPFIIRLFICNQDNSFGDNPQEGFNGTLLMNYTRETNFSLGLNYTNTTYETQFSQSCLELAQSAYLVMGCIVLFTSVPFCGVYLAPFFCLKSEVKPIEISIREEEKDEEGEVKVVSRNSTRRPLVLQVVTCFLLFLFTTLTISIECITVQYIVSFATKYLSWSVRSSSFLITVFFVAHSLSRGSNIFVSIYYRPVFVLAINVLLAILAYALMLVFIDRWHNIIYVSVFLVGFAVASTFPNEVLLVSESVQFTQRMSAITIIGSSMGGVISPFLLTSLITAYGNIYFIYFQITTCVLLFMLFLFQTFFFKTFLKKF